MEQGLDLTNNRPKYQVDPKFTNRMYTKDEVVEAIFKAITYYSNLDCKGPDKRTRDIIERAIKSLG